MVPDGLKCNKDSNAICVDGECQVEIHICNYVFWFWSHDGILVYKNKKASLTANQRSIVCTGLEVHQEWWRSGIVSVLLCLRSRV